MGKREYVSDNLQKFSSEIRMATQKSSSLPSYQGNLNADNKDINGAKFSKAQENRLIDVYRAKLDIQDRAVKSLTRLQQLDALAVEQGRKRRELIDELSEKLDKLKSLSDPEDSKEFYDYVKTVENFRMNFFSLEAQMELNGDTETSEVFGANNVDVKGFYKQLKNITKLLMLLIGVIGVTSLLVAAAIWFSMQV